MRNSRMRGNQRRTSKGIRAIYCFLIILTIVWVNGLVAFVANIPVKPTTSEARGTLVVREVNQESARHQQPRQETVLQVFTKRNCPEDSLKKEIFDEIRIHSNRKLFGLYVKIGIYANGKKIMAEFIEFPQNHL